MLTEQQVLHFQALGFLILRKVFRPDEIQTIEEEFEHGLNAAYRHKPFDGTVWHWVPMLGKETPFLAKVLEDPRFCETAEQFYEDDVIGMACDANRYVGDTKRHHDTGMPLSVRNQVRLLSRFGGSRDRSLSRFAWIAPATLSRIATGNAGRVPPGDLRGPCFCL